MKTRAAANLVLGEVVSLLSWGQSEETADNLYTAIAFLGELGPSPLRQNPVAGNRRIEGTWTRGTEKGTFQIRRL